MAEARIIASGGAIAFGKNHDPPQGAYAVWEVAIPGWPGHTTVKTYPYPKGPP